MQASTSTPKWENYFFMKLAFCTGMYSESTILSKMSLYDVELGFPLTGTKGPSQCNKQTFVF